MKFTDLWTAYGRLINIHTVHKWDIIVASETQSRKRANEFDENADQIWKLKTILHNHNESPDMS